jgi:hypothetical protein
MKLRINVTQDDIDRGRPGDSQRCAIARSLKRIGLSEIIVGPNTVQGRYEGIDFRVDATPEIRAFIAGFDGIAGDPLMQLMTSYVAPKTHKQALAQAEQQMKALSDESEWLVGELTSFSIVKNHPSAGKVLTPEQLAKAGEAMKDYKNYGNLGSRRPREAKQVRPTVLEVEIPDEIFEGKVEQLPDTLELVPVPAALKPMDLVSTAV